MDKRTGTFISHRDTGIGVSQLLPVLVKTCASEEAVIAIEQPEIHLHPALQAELDDVFALNPLDNHAVNGLRANRTRRLGATGKLQDAVHPACGLLGKFVWQQLTVSGQVVFHRTGNGGRFHLRQRGIAQGDDHALPGLALGLAVGLDEFSMRPETAE